MHMVLVADYCGEKLAWFLGITSPKYQSAIDEYNRIKKQVCIIKIYSSPFSLETANRHVIRLVLKYWVIQNVSGSFMT